MVFSGSSVWVGGGEGPKKSKVIRRLQCLKYEKFLLLFGLATGIYTS